MGLMDKLMVITEVIEDNSYHGSQERGRFGRGKANQNIHGSRGSINNEVRIRNPTNSYGKVTCCGICESIYHWAIRSALIKNQAHITRPKLPFLLKRHRNVLWKIFGGGTKFGSVR